MIDRSMVKPYLHYVIPATIAFTLTCIYSIIDGLFVGNVVGDAGLAGINVAWPIYAVVLAVGTGIGMGGAIISSIRSGSGNAEGARRAVAHTLSLLALASIPVTIGIVILARPLCALFGGSGETLNQATLYLSTLAFAAPFQVMVTGCLPLIRNCGHVKYAMCASLICSVFKIMLDYTFIVVFHWGITGASVATVVAQAISCCFILMFFVRKSQRLCLADFRLNTELTAQSLKLGAAPFGLTLLPELTVVAINVNAMLYGGETAVAAYAVISYVAYIVQILIQGIGDGSQPLISQCYGAGKFEMVRKLRNTNFVVALSIGVVSLVVIYLLRWDIPVWFGASAATTNMIAFALPLFAFAYMFFGFTHISSSFFYATENTQASSILVYGEALLVMIMATVLGFLVGILGVWSSVVVVQITLSGMALVLHHFARIKLGLAPAHQSVLHRHRA